MNLARVDSASVDIEEVVTVVQTYRDERDQSAFRDWLTHQADPSAIHAPPFRPPQKSDKWTGFGDYLQIQA